MPPDRGMERWLIGILAVLLLSYALRLAWRRATRHARAVRAVRGEREAEALLEARGYEVRGRQVRAFLEYAIDGAPCLVEVRADYLVARDGRTWVAEVKTGKEAPKLETPATRRQLLEYAHAFDGAGVLLVDADKKRIAHVALPRPRRRSLGPFLLGIALGAGISFAIAAVVAR